MLLIGPGIYKIRFIGNCRMDYMSVSAGKPSFIKAWLNDELIEDAYIGSYSPHTWWTNNSIQGAKALSIGDILKIEIGEETKVRIEGEFEAIA